jgi:hypothetical protein
VSMYGVRRVSSLGDRVDGGGSDGDEQLE